MNIGVLSILINFKNVFRSKVNYTNGYFYALYPPLQGKILGPKDTITPIKVREEVERAAGACADSYIMDDHRFY